MKAFEYAAPTTVEEAVKLLGAPGAAALSGGTDLISRMKDYVTSPDRVVYLKDIKELAGISGDAKAGGLTIGAGHPADRHRRQCRDPRGLPGALAGDGRGRLAPDPQHGHRGRQPAPAAAVLVLPRRPRPAGHEGRQEPGPRRRQSLPRDLHDRRRRPVRQPVEPGGGPVRPRRPGDDHRAPRATRTVKVEELYQVPKRETDSELTIAPGEILTKVTIPAAKGKNASYEARHKQAQDWPLVLASVNLMMDGDTVSAARIVIYGVAPIPWRSTAAENAITGKRVELETAALAGEAAAAGAAPLSMNAYKVPLTKTVVKRALLGAVGNRYWEEA